MNKISLLITILIILNYLDIFSQRNPGTITGKVLDNDSKSFIEYANIVLLSVQDSSLITGTVSDVNGEFTLSDILFGKYRLEVRFIGYNNFHAFLLPSFGEEIKRTLVKRKVLIIFNARMFNFIQ